MSASARLPFRDRIIPWYFVMFFAVVALVDAVLVTIAVRTHTGTVMEHPYEVGLAYNTVVAASDQQAALGWNAGITFVPTAKGGTAGMLRVVLKDAGGVGVTADSVTASITRPTQSGMDQDVTLARAGDGHYMAAVTLPKAGLWEMRVFVKRGGDSFQHAKRLVVE